MNPVNLLNLNLSTDSYALHFGYLVSLCVHTLSLTDCVHVGGHTQQVRSFLLAPNHREETVMQPLAARAHTHTERVTDCDYYEIEEDTADTAS